MRKFKIAVVLFCFGLVSSLSAASGQVEGKVTDAATSDFLPGANVMLRGTAIGITSDLNGVYRILNVPEGEYTLVVSYVGYQTVRIPIVVKGGETTKKDIAMKLSVVQFKDAVTITAQREGQVAAINQQINSDQIVNVIAEEKIQELPDANAAESVARLPGVALQRDGGEAQKVFIRGLDAKFATITLNGIEIPATNTENREIDLSVISQDALAGIELYKALTSDLDADAIAGTVNLITGKAREQRRVRMDFIGSYNGLTKSYDQHNIVGRYSNRFFGKKLGLQASAYSEKRDRSSESFVDSWSIPANLDYRISGLALGYTSEKRKRFGGEFTLDLDTPDKGNIKFVNTYNQTSREMFNTNKSFSSSGSTVQYDPVASDTKIYTFNNSIIGQNYLAGFKIGWAVAHAYTKNNVPFNHVLHFDETGSTKSGMKSIGSIDTLKMPGKYLIPYAWNNFSMAGLYDADFATSESDERNVVAKLDIERPYNLGKLIAGHIKAGYKYRDKIRHRNSDVWRAPYWIRYTQSNYLNENDEVVAKDWANSLWPNGWNGTLMDYLKGPPYPSRTLNKDYPLYPVIDEQMVREWYKMNKNGVSANRVNYEYVYELACNRDKYKVDEQVNAGYLMTKLNLGQLFTVIAGVRYEEENNTYKAKFAPNINGFLESQFCNIIDTTATFIDRQWLPNFHLRFKPLRWWDMRLAATKTLSRPDYQMRLPALVVSYHDQEIEQRNPNLHTAQAWNYDANMSFYSTKYGLLTIAGFYKEIDDIFYWLNDITILNTQQADSLGLPRKYGPYRGFVMDMPVNTDGTKVWGFEIDLQTNLGFLPGLLRNIVLNANYARIRSETIYPRFKLETVPGKFPPTSLPKYYYTKRALFGQVNYVGNVSLGYDLGGFSGRLSVYFQGPYLAGISTFDWADVYRKSYSRWDLVLKQQLSDKISVFMNVNNLTNIIEGNYYDFKHLDQGGVRTGILGDLGVRLTL